MVGVADEMEVDRLEQELESGHGDVTEYLGLVRKLKLRRSANVLKHGVALLNNPSAKSKLGTDVWTIYEQVAVAALDSDDLRVAEECVKALLIKFPDSARVARLEGMWMEAKGQWKEASAIYDSVIQEIPFDSQLHKRKVAIFKAQGKLSEAAETLIKYLDTFMADHEAWRELANIYISQQMYKQAAFCFEELLLAQPGNALYHLGYAEVLYTIGGVENLRTAKKYYASTIELSGGKNLRALYGVCLRFFLLHVLI
ncbi:hypothetical protein O6H91_18G002000 [Diphasiastrum complanatum]|uniref:Uncharacterized protein n=1 Tax=Diphasiastrum complanatum TaxID=34168 RepID=A0ACC2AYT0_DIPCM|nr:hypothetical protein O6H91_18G002000 [Diphasiastrum complanatum]